MKKITPREWIDKWAETSCEGPDDAIIIQEFLNRIFKETETDYQALLVINYYLNKNHTSAIN
jgi:hypothetical protein